VQKIWTRVHHQSRGGLETMKMLLPKEMLAMKNKVFLLDYHRGPPTLNSWKNR
jgi:hypothetical protein